MWNTTYTGNKTITEQIYYSVDNGPWVKFKELTHDYPYAPDIVSSTEYVDYAQLDVRKLPPVVTKLKYMQQCLMHLTMNLSPMQKELVVQGKPILNLKLPRLRYFELPWSGTSLPHYFK